MSEAVKSTRAYDSPRRREQAAATRQAILVAAEDRFVAHGYAATTMAAIAVAAGVAPKTVYVVFETKSGVLRALWHLRLRGDEEDVPVGERDWYRAVLDEPDPERQIRNMAAQSRRIKERAGGLLTVIREGASSDPEIAQLWQRIETQFHEVLRPIVESLRRKGALRRGLGVARATDVFWTLNHPDVWHLLVTRRGWTPAQWERWFADCACQQLLGSG